MNKWLYILTISLGITFLMPMVTTTAASNGDATLFGPQTFVREKGKPVKETVEFSIPMATEVTLWITNGTENEQSKRVSSAVITLNGHNILEPNEINQNVAQIKKSIPVLAGTNSLTVELRSKPGGQISVRLAISVDKMVLVPVFKPIEIDGEPLTVTAIVGSVQTPMPTLAPNVAVTFTINGLGEIPPVIVTTDEDGKAVATFQGFDIPGQGTLTASVTGTLLSASTDIQVITKPAIFLDQGPTELTILAGSHRYTAFGVNLLKDDGIPYHVTFNQTIDGNGIALFHDYEGGWFRTGPITFMVNERIEALTQGTYTMTSTATLVETGESESKELVIKVVTPEELDQLSLTLPGYWPSGVNIGISTDIGFSSTARGTKNPPATLTLEEVDENGVVIATIGILKDNGDRTNHGDLTSGDFIYSGKFTLMETVEGKKFYRTKALHNGQMVLSDIISLEVTRFPIGLAPTSPDCLVQDAITGKWLCSDRLTVGFFDGTSPARIEEIVAAEGATILGGNPALGSFRLQIPGDGSAELVWAIIEAFKAYPEVEYAEPFIQIKLFFPNDPSFIFMQDNMKIIRADEAWQVANGNKNIAIIDTGVSYTHEDLNTKVIIGPDFIDEDNDPMDETGHGTMVAGVAAAASNNGIGIAGVAWDSKILAIRATGSAYQQALVDAIRYAAKKVDIINLSVGVEKENLLWATELYQAVQEANNKGRLLVAAAGNIEASQLQGLTPGQQGSASLMLGYVKMYPCAYDEVFCVGNSSNIDERYITSFYGEWIDIAAPGEMVYSTVTGVTMPPQIPRNDLYLLDSGTSLSAPLVSGAAAVVWSMHPDWSAAQVRERLLKTAKPLPAGLQIGKRLDLFEAVFNGSFEIGDLSEWSPSGECDSREQLGPLVAQHRQRIGYCSTGPAGDGVAGHLEKTFTIQPGVTSLPIQFDYNFVTEEYPEWVNTVYDDKLRVTVTTPNGSVHELAVETVNSSQFQSIGGIDFPGGDSTVGHTGWKTVTVTIPVTQGPGNYKIEVSDAGDEVFDSAVLIDNIRLKHDTP